MVIAEHFVAKVIKKLLPLQQNVANFNKNQNIFQLNIPMEFLFANWPDRYFSGG
jgi:hypothetical protein